MQEEAEILLVENKSSDRELALRALRKANIVNKIHIAKDGAEALDFVFCEGAYGHRRNERLPSIILLDLKLPKVNGIEVLQRLKSDERTKIIPIVVLTSSREGHDVSTCYAHGANSYMVKSIDFNQFSRALSSLGLYWLAINILPPCKCLEENSGGY